MFSMPGCRSVYNLMVSPIIGWRNVSSVSAHFLEVHELGHEHLLT